MWDFQVFRWWRVPIVTEDAAGFTMLDAAVRDVATGVVIHVFDFHW
jgi:hypothetical protein